MSSALSAGEVTHMLQTLSRT